MVFMCLGSIAAGCPTCLQTKHLVVLRLGALVESPAPYMLRRFTASLEGCAALTSERATTFTVRGLVGFILGSPVTIL